MSRFLNVYVFSLNNILFENKVTLHTIYIQFTYTITGLGNKLITFINPAPQDNCLQRTYSIKSCTTLYNNKKIQGNFFFCKIGCINLC